MKKLTVIPALAASLLLGTTLVGCSQNGSTSGSETAPGSTSEAGTPGGTGAASPSGGNSSGGQLSKFTVDGQDYSTVSPYICTYSGGEIYTAGGDTKGDGPYFAITYTPGQEADMLVMVTAGEFQSMNAAEGTSFTTSFDPSTATYSVTGTMSNIAGSGNAPIEISGSCK